MNDRLPIEVRLDPTAAQGQLEKALAALLLVRARQEINNRYRQMAQRETAQPSPGPGKNKVS